MWKTDYCDNFRFILIAKLSQLRISKIEGTCQRKHEKRVTHIAKAAFNYIKSRKGIKVINTCLSEAFRFSFVQ